MFTTSPFLRLSTLIATGVTLVGFGVFAVIAAVDPARFDHLARKDNFADTGIVEHLTVLVLLPAILASVYAMLRWRSALRSTVLLGWLALWTLACVYFAGEECSWGQWYLEFETPEPLTELNDQGEMNLHNMSSWLDQKPRSLVEIFVIVAGFVAPLVWWLRCRAGSAPEPGVSVGPASGRERLLSWTLAPPMCWAAGGVFLFQRVASQIEQPWLQRMGTSEFRELGVAWFLSLYLISYALRMRVVCKARAGGSRD